MSGRLKVVSFGVQKCAELYKGDVIMEKDRRKNHRRIAKINGVKIVNAENSKKQQEKPQKDATAGTRNLVWLMDKDNLEL